MKYFMCTYQVRVGTREILHPYSVDEGLGEGLDGERKDRREEGGTGALMGGPKEGKERRMKD